ncbi:MAG: NAD-dependent epimerase/dehydratase family protein [Pseudomonadota bacterium]
MTTLVTGAAGFLGGLVMRKLAAAGEPVRGFDLLQPASLPKGAEFSQGSVLDPDAVADATQSARHIIHAAAIASLWSPGRFDYDRVNVVGACRVLAAARRAGAKTVHVSSFTTLIRRDTPKGALLDESAEHVPNHLLGPYPRSKRQAELAALAAAAAGQEVTILLPAAPVGAGDVNLTPPSRMIRDLAGGKTPALLDCTLNLVDADAVADAIIAARTNGASGERYLLGGEDLPMRTVADMIAEVSGTPAPRRAVPHSVAMIAARVEALLSRMTKRPPTAPLTGVKLAAHPVTLDSSKAREALEFQPRPVREALTEAIVWLRAKGHLPA